MKTDEELQQLISISTLDTCEYLGGYVDSHSVITLRCKKHNFVFNTAYENVRRVGRPHLVCPHCKEEERKKEQISVICEYCGKSFRIQKSKYITSETKKFFCSRECKDKAQSIDSGEQFDFLRPDHYKDGKYYYRNRALRKYGEKCECCGYNEDIDFLEVHHIDENRENNSIENLIVLCPLCRKKLTTHKYILKDRKLVKKY